MEKMIIHTQNGQYPIYVGQALLEHAGQFIKDTYSGIFIVTDTHVAPRYLSVLENALKGQNTYHYVIPAGESSKTLDHYEKIITAMLEKKMDRTSCVVALGGGVVGDLAGFCAATYLRGVAFIQVPTTLLAHDSSVGGKVGIDHSLGKNLIGAFYPPEAVLYDSSTLESLPAREMKSGFAELAKHSLIASPPFYEDLKLAIPDAASLTAERAGAFLVRGISVKAKIVEQDEHESGIRMHLNFGHTLGHAIEKELGFGTLTHGEAVAIGMIFAMRLSESTLGVQLPVMEISEWFQRLGLPARVPDGVTVSQLMEQMKYDKKNKNGQYHFVLMRQLGQLTDVFLPSENVEHALRTFMNA